MTRLAITAGAALLLCATAHAQDKGAERKVYCWQDHGHQVCGDALPSSAAGDARTEFDANNGRRVGQLGRALTPEEQAVADQASRQAREQAAAQAAAKRRDTAMVESFDTEDDLRRAYGERIAIADEAVKSSVLGEANLRTSLVTLLDQAANDELAGKPVPKVLRDRITRQHADLLTQLRLLNTQRQDRAALDGQLADALERYRALKAPPAPGSDAATANAN